MVDGFPLGLLEARAVGKAKPRIGRTTPVMNVNQWLWSINVRPYFRGSINLGIYLNIS